MATDDGDRLRAIDNIPLKEHDGNGSRDRATVALVDAKIDGIRDLLHAEMRYIREKVEPLTGIITEQERMKSQGDDLERRVTMLESSKKADREWRRVNLPSLIISAAVAVGSIIALVTQIH